MLVQYIILHTGIIGIMFYGHSLVNVLSVITFINSHRTDPDKVRMLREMLATGEKILQCQP